MLSQPRTWAHVATQEKKKICYFGKVVIHVILEIRVLFVFTTIFMYKFLFFSIIIIIIVSQRARVSGKKGRKY